MKYSDDEVNEALKKKITRKRKKSTYIGVGVIIGIFVVVMVVISFVIRTRDNYGNKDNDVSTESVNIDVATNTEPAVATPMEVTTEVVTTEEIDVYEEYGIVIPEKELDFQALYSENPHIYAWILVPGTLIDYPVLQHPTDDSFYLEHNIDGSAGYPGCIYTEACNKKDFSDRNTLVYGHNMGDGSMFASLHYYENSQNFEENPYIFIYTEEKIFVYHIFAAYSFPGVHLMKNYDFTSDKVFEEYLDDILSEHYLGFIREGVEVNVDSKIITLSTCIAGQPDMRFLVQGVLLN